MSSSKDRERATSTLVPGTGTSSVPEDTDFGTASDFDYEGFAAANLAEEPDEEDTDPGELPVPVAERPTIDFDHAPRDDASVDVRELGAYTVVTLRGQINESFDGAGLASRLGGQVLFDLTDVERVTSFGVRAWLKLMTDAKMAEAVFLRASPAIVGQITMMQNFVGPAKVHSIVAPYACEACGSAFGVPYDAVGDRATLRSRNPLTVVCPSCGAAATMDDDPWMFFALDDHLLEDVDDDLARVIESIGATPRRPPVEKSMKGDVTRLRFNETITSSTRLHRALQGLEGKLVMDLQAAPSIDPESCAAVGERILRMPPEVVSIEVHGTPPPLMDFLLEHEDPRVSVRSASIVVRSLERPLRRRVLVDLQRDKRALEKDLPLDLDLPWRTDELVYDGRDAIRQWVVERMASQAADEPTVLVAPSKAPAASPSAGRRGSTAAAVSVIAAVALGLLVGTAVLGAVIWARGGVEPVPTSPVVTASPAEDLPETIGVWSSGGALPPAWLEVPYRHADGVVMVAGHGRAESVAAAAEQARKDAVHALLVGWSRELRTRWPDVPPLPEGPELEVASERFRQAVSQLPMERIEEAALRDVNETEVAARYRITEADLDAFRAAYEEEATFRGLSVRPSPPWSARSIWVSARKSYVSGVLPGDRLVRVGGDAVVDVARFVPTASAAFDALAPGQELVLEFDRSGERVITTFAKSRPAEASGNKNDALPLLPFE